MSTDLPGILDLTQEPCPNCARFGRVTRDWMRAEQDAQSCYLQCAVCLCHVVLLKFDDGRIFETFEEAPVS